MFSLHRAYEVIVLEIEGTYHGSFDAAKLTDYYKAKEDRLHYYITAHIRISPPAQAFARSFTLGDENVYGGYKNMKLVRGKRYHVFQRAMTINGEKVREMKIAISFYDNYKYVF